MNSENLTEKYRPRNFSELVGQAVAKRILQGIVEQTDTRVILLEGLRGTGKTSAARIIQKAVNCMNRQGFDPCGQCENCKRIDSGNPIDIKEINAANQTSIDDVRELEGKLMIKPVRLPFKVITIDECHRMSVAGQTCLLKMIEEPPAHCWFVLCTTDKDKMLDTLIDRCIQIKFKAVIGNILIPYILGVAQREAIAISEEEAGLIFQHSKGSVRSALKALQSIKFGAPVNEVCHQPDYSIWVRLVQAINSSSHQQIREIANHIEATEDWAQTTEALFDWASNAMIRYPAGTSYYLKIIDSILNTTQRARKGAGYRQAFQLEMGIAINEIHQQAAAIYAQGVN